MQVVAVQETSTDLTHERGLALRFAGLKTILSLCNFAVILLDGSMSNPNSPYSLSRALLVAFFFAAYMALSYASLLKGWVRTRIYQDYFPFADVIAATALILATEGYSSPFHIWMTLAVVSAGFGSNMRIPLFTAGLAIIAQSIISAVPQAKPMEQSIFMMRTVYLLGFASLIASATSLLVRQSRTLEGLDSLGEDLHSAVESDEAIRIFSRFLQAQLKASSVIIQPVDSAHQREAYGHYIAVGSDVLFMCTITRSRALNDSEGQLVRLSGDRLATALKRIYLTRALVDAAAREERQRYADEMHDTHLQTLAAVDMHAQVASKISRSENLNAQLQEIKQLVRDAASRTRAFIRTVEEQPPSGPDALRSVLEDRWPGTPASIESQLDLTEGQWRVVQMMLQEGINNARRHGDARKGHFALGRTPDGIEASLKSDGRAPKPGFRYGYGLKRLDTVSRANGGEVSLIGTTEGGSKLSVLFRSEVGS